MIIAVISVEQRIDSRNFHVRHSKVSDEHEMLKAKGDDKILKTLSMKLQHSNCTVTPSKTFQLRYKNIKKMKLFFCFFQFISNSEFRLFISGKVLKMHQYFTNTNTSRLPLPTRYPPMKSTVEVYTPITHATCFALSRHN
jgi:hypothetical protein